MFEQIARIAGVGHCGEHGTLAHRWTTWKAEFELYVTASGISDATQKKALLLHLAGPRVRDIFNNSIPAEVRGGAEDYDKAMERLSFHFKHRKNAPMARQTSLAAIPLAGYLQFYYSFAETRGTL